MNTSSNIQEIIESLKSSIKTGFLVVSLLIIILFTFSNKKLNSIKTQNISNDSTNIVQSVYCGVERVERGIERMEVVLNGMEGNNLAIRRNLVRFGELGEELVKGTTNLVWVAKQGDKVSGVGNDGVKEALEGMDKRITFWAGENTANWNSFKEKMNEFALWVYSQPRNVNNVPSVINVIPGEYEGGKFSRSGYELAEGVGYDLEGTIIKQMETLIREEVMGSEGIGREELRNRLEVKCEEIIRRSFRGFKAVEGIE